ncbi:uncharacterized protein LOC136034982 isoform X3 [Artemia franciscana]|uniref:uncharacterized protein LOC136034982 isoform X3 n=1 Tax=Artemia franciscana TaxID=6661 RepID=UPI0032DA05E6
MSQNMSHFHPYLRECKSQAPRTREYNGVISTQHANVLLSNRGYPHNGSIKPLSQQPLAPMQTVPPGLGGLQPSPMPHHPFQQFNQPPRPQSMGWRPRLQEQSSSESAPQFPQCGRSLPNQPPQGPSHWAAYQRLANQGPLGPSWEEQFLPRPTVSAVSNQQLSVQFLRPSTPPPCDLRFDYQESHSTDASYNGYSDDSLDTQQRAIPPTIFENTQGPFNHCLFRDFDEDRWWTENGSKSEEEGTHEPIEKDPKAASNYDPPSCDVLPSFHSNIKGVIRFRRSILIPPSGKIYEPKTLNNRLAGCKTIIIYGLPIKISEVVLFEIFGPMNRLKMIYARKKPRARIRFNKCDDAEKAFKFVGYKIHIDGNAGTEYTGYLRMEYSWKNRRKVQPLVLPSNGQYEVPLSHLYELKRTLRGQFPAVASELLKLMDQGYVSQKNIVLIYDLLTLSISQIQKLNRSRKKAEDKLRAASDKSTEEIEQLEDNFQKTSDQINMIEKIVKSASQPNVWNLLSKKQQEHIEQLKKKGEETLAMGNAESKMDDMEVLEASNSNDIRSDIEETGTFDLGKERAFYSNCEVNETSDTNDTTLQSQEVMEEKISDQNEKASNQDWDKVTSPEIHVTSESGVDLPQPDSEPHSETSPVTFSVATNITEKAELLGHKTYIEGNTEEEYTNRINTEYAWKKVSSGRVRKFQKELRQLCQTGASEMLGLDDRGFVTHTSVQRMFANVSRSFAQIRRLKSSLTKAEAKLRATSGLSTKQMKDYNDEIKSITDQINMNQKIIESTFQPKVWDLFSKNQQKTIVRLKKEAQQFQEATSKLPSIQNSEQNRVPEIHNSGPDVEPSQLNGKPDLQTTPLKASLDTNVTQEEAKLLGVMTAFLSVQPTGANIHSIVSYVRQVIQLDITVSLVEKVLKDHSNTNMGF